MSELSNIVPPPLGDHSRVFTRNERAKMDSGRFNYRIASQWHVPDSFRYRIKVEVNRYDSTRGRIIFRRRNKDSKD